MTTTSGRILSIEIEDFKSYKGKHSIGPITNFTCVIGANGTGKSNIMDSISFVMGLRANQLRSTNLKELIYDGDKSGEYKPKSASVTLVFETTEQETINFKRSITSSGNTEYSINEKNVNLSQYDQVLSEFGILTKARNFLVFQGDVETIAAKSPKDLSRLVEQVSGSDQFVKDYETAKEERERAQEHLIACVNKKKGVTVEKNKVKLQKKDAEKYTEYEEDLARLQTEYHLWKLYYVEKGIKKIKSEKTALEMKNISSKNVETEIDSKKKVLAKLHKDSLELGKVSKKHNKVLTDKYSQLAELKIAIQHLEKNLENQRKDLVKRNQFQSQRDSEMKHVKQQIASVEKEAVEWEKNLPKSKEIKLADTQLNEYNQLKNQAGTLTITLAQELATLVEERDRLTASLANAQGKLDQLEARRVQLEKQIIGHAERETKLLEIVSEATLQLKEKRDVKARMDRENSDRVKRKTVIESDLFGLKEKLSAYKAEKKENERDVKFKDALDSMKRLFPGVKGKVSDLCKIPQSKYNVAVTVALGKNMNAIVVDHEKTAIECIEYLKEQRAGKATFLPLDSLKFKKSDDKLRQLGDSVKLVIDIIEFDEVYSSVFGYALSNTLVVDSLESAGELKGVKIVTLDGSVISKAGLITGGLAEIERHASKWQEKDVSTLKQKRDQLLLELSEITRQEALYTSQKLDSEISALENRIKYTQVDIGFTKNKTVSANQELESIEDEKAKIDLTSISSSLSALERKISALEGEIIKMEERVFAKFSQQVGVNNIRQYEATQLKQQQEAIKKRSEFKLLISRLQDKLNYESGRSVDVSILPEDLEQGESKLESLEEQSENVSAEIKQEEENAKKWKQQAKELNRETEDVESTLNQLYTRLEEINKEMQRNVKSINLKESEIEQLRAKRQEVLRKCQLEDINLPTGGDAKRRKKNEEDEEEEEEEEYIPLSEPFTMSQTEEKRQEQSTLNFSLLKRTQLNLSDAQFEKQDQAYKALIVATQEELVKLAPALSSIDKLDSVNAKFNENEEIVQQARQAVKEAERTFDALKEKRTDLFMKAFDPIQQSIDGIYKQLTLSEDGKVGGTAFLGLEDISEPYNGGIKFNALPPLKRYRDISELSGGEKTIASIALLFAIHQFRPSPFFIMDEVDAALDNANVKKLANFVEHKCPDLQFLVISLKDVFFARGETLIGVCKDKSEKTSKTYSLDLRNFE